jgi:AraC-like DNA-binding protein
MLLVEEGCLHIGENGQSWELKRGDSLILLPDGHHYGTDPCTERTTFYWVHFQIGQEVQYSRLFPYVMQLPKLWTLPNAGQMFALAERLIACATMRRSQAVWQEQQLMLEWLQRMDEGQRISDKRAPSLLLAEQTEAYIKQHYTERVSNESLAMALHFHVNYITRCMKEHFDCTPMEYLHHYRLEQAQLLLAKTDRTVAEVAEQVGYTYAPYFTTSFKQAFGITPSAYRKQFVEDRI